MKYYLLEPEVPGGFGENAELDPTVRPPRIQKFHFEFHAWTDDAILTTFPAFVITTEAAQALSKMGVGGIEVRDVEVTVSGEYEDIYGERPLPHDYLWLKISGEPFVDDLALSDGHDVIVSERALDVLRRLGIRNAIVTPLSP